MVLRLYANNKALTDFLIGKDNVLLAKGKETGHANTEFFANSNDYLITAAMTDSNDFCVQRKRGVV